MTKITTLRGRNEDGTRKTMWYVYMLKCCNDALYTGITNDLARRIATHAAGKGGRFTRSFRPVEVVFVERCRTKRAALGREARIKRLSRKEKLTMVAAVSGTSATD